MANGDQEVKRINDLGDEIWYINQFYKDNTNLILEINNAKGISVKALNDLKKELKIRIMCTHIDQLSDELELITFTKAEALNIVGFFEKIESGINSDWTKSQIVGYLQNTVKQQFALIDSPNNEIVTSNSYFFKTRKLCPIFFQQLLDRQEIESRIDKYNNCIVIDIDGESISFDLSWNKESEKVEVEPKVEHKEEHEEEHKEEHEEEHEVETEVETEVEPGVEHEKETFVNDFADKISNYLEATLDFGDNVDIVDIVDTVDTVEENEQDASPEFEGQKWVKIKSISQPPPNTFKFKAKMALLRCACAVLAIGMILGISADLLKKISNIKNQSRYEIATTSILSDEIIKKISRSEIESEKNKLRTAVANDSVEKYVIKHLNEKGREQLNEVALTGDSQAYNRYLDEALKKLSENNPDLGIDELVTMSFETKAEKEAEKEASIVKAREADEAARYKYSNATDREKQIAEIERYEQERIEKQKEQDKKSKTANKNDETAIASQGEDNNKPKEEISRD